MSTTESPTKVIFDASIYIPFINKGIACPNTELSVGKPLLYMSAVVIEELYAGAFDKVSVKLLDRMYKAFETVGRLITPDSSDWQMAGKIIAKLGDKYGFEDILLARITNDVLISLSARRIGAIIVTSNRENFLKINEFVNIKVYK